MGPDPEFIARRRLTARTILRLTAMALLVLGLLKLLELVSAAVGLGFARSNIGDLLIARPLQALLLLMLMLAPYPAGALLLVMFERRLVAWLIPAPRPYRCPACDYDLRYHTADRCPECGLRLERPPS